MESWTHVVCTANMIINSLAPGRFEWNFKQVVFKLILVIDDWDISCEIALRWFALDLADEKSTLVQVMAWCRQATSHYLSQGLPRSVSPYGVTRPQCVKVIIPTTVGTPYNTAPYITGSNIARLGHGSQNSWSKLWIPFVKSAPVRVIFTWKSVPKKSIHGSSDIYLGTQWKQRHDSPWSYRSDVIVTFLWYGTMGIIWHRDHQSTAKKV